MGAGKSTVSAKLSELLAMEIMEMDAYIQKKEGMSITDIFATNGEEYFRNCESNTLIELREKKHMVVSCGGGVPLREKNVELMKNSGYVVWLTATPEAIYESEGQHGAPSFKWQYERALHSKPDGKPQRKIRKSGRYRD